MPFDGFLGVILQCDNKQTAKPKFDEVDRTMLMLCSNELTSNELIEYVKAQHRKTAALVVTADYEHKEKNYHVSRAIEELKQCSLIMIRNP